MTSQYTRIKADDGSVGEYYYDNDKLHRDDGPAVIERKPDGSLTEKFYRHGQLFQPDSPAPAVVERNIPEDSTTERYAREGEIYEVDIRFGPNSPMKTRRLASSDPPGM